MYFSQYNQMFSSEVCVQELLVISVTIFVFLNFELKVCSAAWIMPSFGGQFVFISFHSVVLR